MGNSLELWNKVRSVPPTALKTIAGGRIKGMSDINPVWRLKTLTEQFGFCGIGWKYEIIEKRLERGAKDEIAAFVDINLYIWVNNEWSAAIPGTGGSAFVKNESGGLYTSDECFKMALTDAISVSCKALGIGADVYWDKDKTKYSESTKKEEAVEKKTIDTVKAKGIHMLALRGTLKDSIPDEEQRKAVQAERVRLLDDILSGFGYTELSDKGHISTASIRLEDYAEIMKLLERSVENILKHEAYLAAQEAKNALKNEANQAS